MEVSYGKDIYSFYAGDIIWGVARVRVDTIVDSQREMYEALFLLNLVVQLSHIVHTGMVDCAMSGEAPRPLTD